MAKTKWPKLPRYLIPLFHSANVYLCRSSEEWNAACSHLKVNAGNIEMLQGCVTSFQNVAEGENLYLLGVFNGGLATLVHECAHVCFYACRDVGVIVDTAEANETYCYMLDRMFSHFAPLINKQE